MNFIFAHAVMIHGAGVGTVGVQHGAAGVGVSIIDLTIIDIVRGDVLFGIRGDGLLTQPRLHHRYPMSPFRPQERYRWPW